MIGADLHIAARTIWRIAVLIGCTYLWLLGIRGALHAITDTPWSPDRIDAVLLAVSAIVAGTASAWNVLDTWSRQR